jgi:hypothetical protein
MRFQCDADWPGPGNVFVAAGTIIDTDLPEWEWVAATPLPTCLAALDQAACDALATQHPETLHKIRTGFPPVLRSIQGTLTRDEMIEIIGLACDALPEARAHAMRHLPVISAWSGEGKPPGDPGEWDIIMSDLLALQAWLAGRGTGITVRKLINV